MLTEERTAGWVSCPKCSRRARRGQNFCELCGVRLHDAAEEESSSRGRYSCEGCGASVVVPREERTTTCAFCGTPYVRLGEISAERFAPEFVLPFTVGRRDAEDAFRRWLRAGGWFCPGDFRDRGRLSVLRGVYVPFWSFTMRSESSWRARIGEYWWETVVETYTTTVNGKTVTRTRTRRVRHTEWYPLAGRFHQFHSGYLVSASKGLPQATADALHPFPVTEVTRYAPHFLSGWLCEEYTLERTDAARISEEEFRQREARDVTAFLPGDCSSDVEVSSSFHDPSEDLILLPVWVFAYSYQNRVYRFTVNGATGRSHGDRPVSRARVAVAVLLVVILVALLVGMVALVAGGM